MADDVGEDRAADLAPQMEHPEDDGQDPEGDGGRDHRHHRVAKQLLRLGGVPLLPQVHHTNEETGHHLAQP